MVDVIAKIESLPHQIKFVHSEARHPALVGGYGSGKTEAGIQRIIHKKFEYPDNDVAVYAPTYSLIRDIWIRKLEEFFRRYNITYNINFQYNYIVIANRGRIILRSLTKPENIIGYEVSDSVIDELDTLPRHRAKFAWDKIIARNRQPKPDRKVNSVGIMTTPEGYGFTYDVWQKNNQDNAEFELIKASTYDNPFLPPGYIDSLIESYDETLLQAYLHGEFVNFNQGTVYYSFKQTHVADNLVINPIFPIFVCVDFNVSPMIWEIAQIVDGEIRVLYEIKANNTNTWEMSHRVKDLIPNSYDVVVFGDSAGSSRNTRSTYSDYNIIDEEFRSYFRSIEYRVPKANPPVRDRVLCVNSQLSHQKMLISNTCKELIEDFVQIVYNEKGEVDKSDLSRTHASDALGYMVSVECPIAHKNQNLSEVRQL